MSRAAVGQHRRLEEVAAARMSPSARHEAGSFGQRIANVRLSLGDGLAVDQRPDCRARSEPVADRQPLAADARARCMASRTTWRLNTSVWAVSERAGPSHEVSNALS